jgi:DNA-binding transcriptional regulator YiaG
MESRARQFLIELRGDLPTEALAERLGYRADPFPDWESGDRWPTAAEALRVCAACGVELSAAFRAFDPEIADVLGDADDRGVSAWLRATAGRTDPSAIARRLGRPTSTVRRWLGGQVRPLWPEFLAIVELMTERGDELLRLLTPTRAKGSATPMRAARRRSSSARGDVIRALAEARRVRGTPPPAPRRQREATPLPRTEMPQPQAVRSRTRAPTEVLLPHTLPVAAGPAPTLAEFEETDVDEITVETFSSDGEPITLDDPAMDGACGRVWDAIASKDYATLEQHRPGWIEARTGLSEDEVDERIRCLADAGAIVAGSDRWRAAEPRPMFGADRRPQPTLPPELATVARTRAAQVTLSLTDDDVLRVRRLQRATAAELAAIEASSRPKQTLLLVRADPAP